MEAASEIMAGASYQFAPLVLPGSGLLSNKDIV